MRIGIAGAGLLGRLLAFQLGRAGHAVEVFDPAADANARAAAGWTAAGMLSPVAELECADQGVFALGLRSLDLWPQWLAQLDQPVQFSRRGSLLLAHRGDEGAAQRVVELLRSKAPASHAPEALTPAQLRELEPTVQGPAHAWLLQGEGQIHTVQAMQALACASRGVTWHWQHTVDQVQASSLRANGELHRFDWVFDVRGLGARPQLPLRGVRGEIFWLHAPGVALQRPLRLLHPRHRVYLVPREGDVVVVGASEIESEDRSPVSVRSTVELLAAAHSVLPELAEARLIHSETNLRPALPDNLPRVDSQAGLTRINGLFRHGWLIAPALVQDALHHMETTKA
ncbi:glycine oxidase ThiO [uncultured Ramlibacter sp.]|uniref:glycine oxidase ThiO n=1 Tax=uncultured Ramlibacter sp. TaxID=260755 RepID=UPI0026081543|nr:glycine oxidase ThiO [uncultured Ramlibacter sp.]